MSAFSSIAGIATTLLALGLFEYRFFHDQRWSWDLFAIVLAFIVLKMSLFTWYRINA